MQLKQQSHHQNKLLRLPPYFRMGMWLKIGLTKVNSRQAISHQFFYREKKKQKQKVEMLLHCLGIRKTEKKRYSPRPTNSGRHSMGSGALPACPASLPGTPRPGGPTVALRLPPAPPATFPPRRRAARARPPRHPPRRPPAVPAPPRYLSNGGPFFAPVTGASLRRLLVLGHRGPAAPPPPAPRIPLLPAGAAPPQPRPLARRRLHLLQLPLRGGGAGGRRFAPGAPLGRGSAGGRRRLAQEAFGGHMTH